MGGKCMKNRKLMYLLFGMFMFDSLIKVETSSINVYAAGPDIVIEDDENPDGVTLLGTGEDAGDEASTCGTGPDIEIEDDENPDGVTLLGTGEDEGGETSIY